MILTQERLGVLSLWEYMILMKSKGVEMVMGDLTSFLSSPEPDNIPEELDLLLCERSALLRFQPGHLTV